MRKISEEIVNHCAYIGCYVSQQNFSNFISLNLALSRHHALIDPFTGTRKQLYSKEMTKNHYTNTIIYGSGKALSKLAWNMFMSIKII